MNELTISNKLYGRDREVMILLDSFEHISSGHGQVLLVQGSSGVGKTALVQKLQTPISDRNGFFIKGKFEQYQQNIPYFAFRQALAELCRKLQSGNEQDYARFKAEIIQSIGNLGQVLIEFVPEFESFLGSQLPLGEISPQEARHRFADVLRNFLKVICKPEHPLVLFIDDWQWADAASCELLRQLQVGVTLRYLQVIVSYRDNEVDPSHPLMLAVNDLQSRDVSMGVLQVKNITANDVQALVADTLKPATEDVEGLAAIIHNQTLGNSFFVRSFFSFLHDLNLIWIDNDGKRWKWHINIAEGIDLPENVVELFALKLRRLDADSQNLFSLAACLGNSFDLEMLSIISGYSTQKCLSILFTGEAKTLLLPLDRESVNGVVKNDSDPTKCTFLHDKVQQAAYTLVEPKELPSILLKIGRLLLNSLQPEQLDERLFEVVNDLNAGSHLIQETVEKMKMVELNIMAARKAYAATAYRSALQFYRVANGFLEKPGFAKLLWLEHHELTMNLLKDRAVCEFLEGDRSEGEKCIQEAVAHSISALEKAQVLNILIVQYTLLARYPEAIASGKQALAALGISLPEDNFEQARDVEIALVRQDLKDRFISSLADLPVMTNPEMLMAAKILITMGPPCYRSHQRLWSVIVPKVVNLTLRYGNLPQVGYSHTAFGGLLGWVDSDYATAKEFGELATRLMTGTFQSPSDQSVFYLMIGSSIRHWFKHLSYGSQDYTDAYEIGLRSGNLQYAAYAFGHNMYCRFYQGVPLSSLIQESQHSLEFSQSRQNQWAIDLLEGGLNIFGILSSESFALDGNVEWADAAILKRVDAHHNIQVECIYKVLKTFALLLSGSNVAALESSDKTEPLIYTVGTQGLLPWPEHVFARMLILTALYSKASAAQKNQWHTELDMMLNKLRIWAENCPENFGHKYLLASAELARIDGQPVKAMQLYDQAIEAARVEKFIQWEGIANERASNFWIEAGNECLADVYWKQAYICYNHWGAKAKVYSMENEYQVRIAKNFPGMEGSDLPTTKQEQAIKYELLDRQIKILRNYALQKQQTKLLNEAETLASELALATQRLRVEIAERKRTEEALRESEEFSRYILQTIPFGMDIVDENGIVLFQSENLKNHFKEEVIGNKCWCIYRDDKTQCSNCPLRAGINIGITEVYESTGILGGRIFEITHTGIMFEGKKAMLEIFIDITERRQTQEQIQHQNEELQKINAEKDKLFSIIAHDLKSPMNSFLGLTQIMAEELPSLTLAQIQKIVVTMSKSANNLYCLLENLLQWSQIQQGAIPFNPEVIQLRRIVVGSIEMILDPAKIKGIEIETDIAEEMFVFADNNMFQTIIRNLVSNAIKFTPKGGKVKASARLQDNKNYEISIQDTGIGMSQTMLGNLFRIDAQTNRKGTDEEPSTGLGLILCKEFVEKNGGRIWVESEVGKGATFYFTLPKSEIQIDNTIS